MRERLAMPQPAALLQRRFDVRVRVEHPLSGEHVDGVEEVAARADRRVDVEAVAHARVEVVRAVPRRRVHRAGAGLERHVIAEHAERGARVERVHEADPLHLLALEARERRGERDASGLGDFRRQRLRHDDHAAADLVRRVIEFRMEGDRQVRRNRPRRRRPDQHRDVEALQLGDPAAELLGAGRREGELDVDRRRGVLLVFHFRLGKRGAAMNAPVHRLLALVDESLLDELPERPRDRRLVLEVHRQVGVLPVAEDPEALELLRHHADVALGVGAAGAAEIGDAHLALLRPELAIDLQLDRQAVAVVARHVR